MDAMQKQRICSTSLSMLLALLLCLLSLLPLHAGARENEKTDLVYLLRLSRLDPVFLPAVREDAPLIDRVGKYPIGRLLSVKSAPHMQETYSQEKDALTLVPHPYLLDVTLTVKAEGVSGGTYYSLGGYRLTVGSTVSFHTPTFASVGECIAIYEGGDAK